MDHRDRQGQGGGRHGRPGVMGRRQCQFASRPAVVHAAAKPYVPSGTLRRAVAYPGAAEDWTVEEIGEALDKVGIGHLKEKIEEDAPWDQTLSGGEKQRLAFARLFLHNPDIIVLDWATSALDAKSQDQMMELIN